MKNLVRKIFLFKNLNFDLINQKYNVLDSFIKIEYKQNEIISYSTGLPIIIQGRAKIVSKNGSILKLVNSGDIFAAASLFSDISDASTKTISMVKTTVVYMPVNFIKKLIQCEPQVAINYIEFLSGRVNFLNSKIDILSQGDTISKLVYFILECNSDLIELPLTYSELAKSLDIGRASLYRSFDELISIGAIEKSDNIIRILDKEKLLQIIT